MKLFMVLIGCTPVGRHTEQHDVFFGVAENIKDLIPEFIEFWPEAKHKMHLDGWREVHQVNGMNVHVELKSAAVKTSTHKLFFINLGGYKQNEFEEFHYKMIIAAKDKADAILQAKQSAFYKHTGFEGAPSHIDDKYGVDVDDIYEIEDILSPSVKEKYSIVLSPANEIKEDGMQLGYFKLDKL
jgi:Domain of Unknown Function (DUF1543)